jgi:1,5-anhydro-D-fructose reductase (1,5-anhydro-D-mannitol-forming)
MSTSTVKWGMIGCGDVTEVKSGPGLRKASGSALVAVMRRDVEKARDYASRHGVPRVHAAAAALIDDPDVDAVYIATPPSSHCELALRVASAGKPCLVEKPMAMTHGECLQMADAFRAAGVPLWVAYYRRALPRFLLVRQLLTEGTIGRVTSVHVEVFQPLATGEQARNWRFDPATAGAGLFFDLASHCVDLLDFLIAPVVEASGIALNTGHAYDAEDVVVATFKLSGDVAATGIWNFNAPEKRDSILISGTGGEIRTPVFADDDVIVRSRGAEMVHNVRNPPHVHQPLVQTIVDELRGQGRCESTADSGARASWVLDRCIAQFYVSRA